MDDLGNVFYILRTIVIIIGSLFGKKKKPTTNSKPSKSVFEELFGSEVFGQQQPNLHEQDLYSYKKTFDDPFDDLDDKYTEAYSSEVNNSTEINNSSETIVNAEQVLYNNNIVEQKKAVIFEEEINIEEDENSSSVIESFNAKDAVIYSAILERKYF